MDTKDVIIHKTGGLKEYILNNISEVTIFARYLGINESDILDCMANKHRISNPLRSDNNPSLTFKQYSSKIIMIDYANSRYRGDIFEVVGLIIGKDSLNSKQFLEICTHIIGHCKASITSEKPIVRAISNIRLSIEERPMNNKDMAFFRKIGLKDNVIRNNIKSVDSYYIDDVRTSYRYLTTDPCYKYDVNPNNIKLYFPNRAKGQNKFMTDNKCPIENIDELKGGEHLILIKSFKDKLLLKQMLEELDITSVQVVSTASETVVLNNKITTLINTRYANTYVIFDNDAVGLESSVKWQTDYGFTPIYFCLPFVSCKDPSDAVRKYGYTAVLTHLRNIIIEQRWT